MSTHRTLLLVAVALFLSSSASAQEEQPMRTLFGGGDKHSGGWGAPTASYTRIMHQDAMLVGVRGGWIIDHRFTLGLAGHGLVTKVDNPGYDEAVNSPFSRGDNRFFLGYGGLLLEPVIAYRSPVHITLPVIIGAGGCGYYYAYDQPVNGSYGTVDDVQGFFVLEPGIELEMNVIRLVRVGLGASYRYTSDLDLPGTSANALHGWNAGISIKVGSF